MTPHELYIFLLVASRVVHIRELALAAISSLSILLRIQPPLLFPITFNGYTICTFHHSISILIIIFFVSFLFQSLTSSSYYFSVVPLDCASTQVFWSHSGALTTSINLTGHIYVLNTANIMVS